MRHVPALVATILAVASPATLARADIYIVHRQGANIVPERSTDISMDAEDVRIECHEDGYMVTATFMMRNQSDRTIDSLVAFPITGSTYSRTKDLNREFRLEVKGGDAPDSTFTPVKARVKTGRKRTAGDDYLTMAPPKTIGDYPEVVVWNVRWEPRQTKVIRVRFNMGEPMSLPGSNRIAAGWQLMYVVTTGSLWQGPIGRADISIRFTTPTMKAWPPLDRYRQVSYPDHARWSGNDLVAWHFENWTPTEEIWVRSAWWTGFSLKDVHNYRFQLPYEYQGTKGVYTEATIEDLVTRDLSFPTEYFPTEVQALDRGLLRIAIADWLLHEIYARHGDSFYLGKESPTFPFLEHMVGDGEGNLYSLWFGLFTSYSYPRGWYRPQDSPPVMVKTSSLHPVEQKNVTFLRAYLAKLRSMEKYRELQKTAHTPGMD